MKVWSWIVGGVGLIAGGIQLQNSALHLFSLNKNIAMDVYFSSDACEHALEFKDKLQSDSQHFLLVSNCFHTKSFQDAESVWPFELVLPSLVYEHNRGDPGRYFERWLQQPTGRIEHLPPEKLSNLRLLTHTDGGAQIEALHFLCAHPELLAQHPKPPPKNAWEQNQYSVLKGCLADKRYPHQIVIPDSYTEESTGAWLATMFESDASILDFDRWVEFTLLDHK